MFPNSPAKHLAVRRLKNAVSFGFVVIILGSWLIFFGDGLHAAGAQASLERAAERSEMRERFCARRLSNLFEGFYPSAVTTLINLQPTARHRIRTAGGDPFAFLIALGNGNVERLIYLT